MQKLLVKKIIRYSLQNWLVTRCRSCLWQKSLVTDCKICSMHFANLFTTCYLLQQWTTGDIVYLKAIKLGETFSFFNLICFLKQNKWKLFQVNVLVDIHLWHLQKKSEILTITSLPIHNHPIWVEPLPCNTIDLHNCPLLPPSPTLK